MDLRHHLLVWWRWRVVLAAGLLLAVMLGTLVSFKPTLAGGPSLKWRNPATYSSTSRLFVTQPGFPWGRATLPGANPNEINKSGTNFAAPDRFSNLALVYSYIAQSDVIRRLIYPRPLTDQIQVVTPNIPGSADPLPLLEITTKAPTAVGARRLNTETIKALDGFIKKELDDNQVAAKDRVQLQVLNPPDPGALTAGRSPTLSVVAWILVMIATFTGVYVLENLYSPLPPSRERQPTVSLVDPEEDEGDDLDPQPDQWPATPAAGTSAACPKPRREGRGRHKQARPTRAGRPWPDATPHHGGRPDRPAHARRGLDGGAAHPAPARGGSRPSRRPHAPGPAAVARARRSDRAVHPVDPHRSLRAAREPAVQHRAVSAAGGSRRRGMARLAARPAGHPLASHRALPAPARGHGVGARVGRAQRRSSVRARRAGERAQEHDHVPFVLRRDAVRQRRRQNPGAALRRLEGDGGRRRAHGAARDRPVPHRIQRIRPPAARDTGAEGQRSGRRHQPGGPRGRGAGVRLGFPSHRVLGRDGHARAARILRGEEVRPPPLVARECPDRDGGALGGGAHRIVDAARRARHHAVPQAARGDSAVALRHPPPGRRPLRGAPGTWGTQDRVLSERGHRR